MAFRSNKNARARMPELEEQAKDGDQASTLLVRTSNYEIRSVHTNTRWLCSHLWHCVFIPFKSPVSSHQKKIGTDYSDLGFHPVQKSGQFAPQRNRDNDGMGKVFIPFKSPVSSYPQLQVQIWWKRPPSFHPVQKSGQFTPSGLWWQHHEGIVFIPFKSPVSSHLSIIGNGFKNTSRFSSRSKVRSVRTA